MSASGGEVEQVLEHRRRAEECRALAAEHRARAHELRAGGSAGDDDEGVDSDAFLHAGIEEVLAEVAELRADGFDQRAAACEALVQAQDADTEERGQLMGQAGAAVIRAAELEAEAIALRDELAADPRLHEALSEAAIERARAREQRSLAAAMRARLAEAAVPDELLRLRAERHEAWADLHERLALVHQLGGEGLSEPAEASQREAERLRQLAQAAEERVALAQRGIATSESADAAA